MIKYFRFSKDYILWGIGFTDLKMMLAAIPVPELPETPGEEKGTYSEGLDGIALEKFI